MALIFNIAAMTLIGILAIVEYRKNKRWKRNADYFDLQMDVFIEEHRLNRIANKEKK
jgi:hypothetical protein